MWFVVVLSALFIFGTCSFVHASVIGGESVYTVVKGDTLDRVAAKLGVPAKRIAEINGLDPKKRLSPGLQLKILDRKIIPATLDEGIVINIPERRLYLFKDRRLVDTFPVALGLSHKSNGFDWRTPTGKFVILAKQKDPTWFVPPSIQEEMEKEGKEVVTSVPPGPANPLGKYALKTSIPGILIHETNKPASISRFASHGCIRVHPAHMEKFFPEVTRNTPGEILYMPVKVAVTDGNRVFLEVNGDAYGKFKNLRSEAELKIQEAGAAQRVDWTKVERMLTERNGIAEDVSL
ncbi:MAG TPA: L,D-transpeptidase family protein [Dissulfurispiraceae bacterium]|nr:L,D-transpeptidase family protein [Dissulfurispiraceae bacterium]